MRRPSDRFPSPWTVLPCGAHVLEAAGPPRSGAVVGHRSGRTSVSRVELVLTLLSRKEEGHLAYRSQSDNPLQGTTLGGSTDDPGREHTRDATACHAAGGDDGRQRGVPGSWDLPHVVLSLAPATAAVWRRWSASPSVASPARARPPGGAGRRAPVAGRGDRRGDVGRGSAGRLRPAAVGAAGGGQYRAAPAAPTWPGHAAPAAARPRASQCAAGRLAHRAHPARPLASAARAHAPRRGDVARRARLPGHLLHRQ